jgi:hypothetical protein
MSNDKKMQDERELFEAAMLELFGITKSHLSNERGFSDLINLDLWRLWQARAALSVQGEPVGYFIDNGPGAHTRICRVSDSYKNDPDVFPMFTYPPSAHTIAKQMREQCAEVVLHYMTMPRHAFYDKYGVKRLVAVINDLPLPDAPTEPAAQAVEAKLVEALAAVEANWVKTGFGYSNEVRAQVREALALIPTKAEPVPAQASDDALVADIERWQGWLDSQVDVGSNDFDEAPAPLTKFDYELSQLVAEMGQVIAAHRAKQSQSDGKE